MKKIFSLILLSVPVILFSTISTQAQLPGYQGDALRYSQTLPGGGTARIRALGGVGTALGGDLSSAYLNPAGLGFYNRSEVSITPTFFSNGNDATYFGQSNYSFKNQFNLSHLGFAFRGAQNNDSGWLGGTFAITYQQLNNFENQINYSGNNPDNTFADRFLQFTDNEIDSQFDNGDIETYLAYQTYILDDFEEENGTSYYDTYFAPAALSPSLQRESIRTRGSQGQWNFSYGGNYNDKIYIGAGIGLSSFTYRRNSTFTESTQATDFYPNNQIIVEEELRQTGNGINATLGIIGRPVENLTVGISYKTPTFHTIEEDFHTSYETRFVANDFGVPTRNVLDTLTYFDFQLKTPGVLNFGAAYFFEKYGLITADVEYTDYSNMKLTDSYNSLSNENEDLSRNFSSVINYRLGGELRYDIFRFRLGYAYQANPYAALENENLDTQIYSAGFGVRLQSFYADLAFVQQRADKLYSPYGISAIREGADSNGDAVFAPTTSPEALINNRQSRALLTVGFNF